MKRRSLILIILFVFVLTAVSLFTLTGCKKSQAGETMALVPAEATGVIDINFKKFSQLEFFDKWIKESESKKAEIFSGIFTNYQDFVNKTGIDLKKDIRSVGMAVLGKSGFSAMDQNMVVLANLNSKNDKLEGFLKTQGDKVVPESYNGETIYKFKTEDTPGKEVGLTVIKGITVVFGTPEGVRKVADVAEGKSKSIKENLSLKPYLEKMNPEMIFSFAFIIPDEAKKVSDMGLVKLDFSKSEAITGYGNYMDKTWKGLIQLICKNEPINQQLAGSLNSVKSMGAIAGPEFAELVNKITITATSESVKIDISIPDELIEKIKNKMQEKKKMEPPTFENTAPADSTQPKDNTNNPDAAQPTTSQEGQPQ